MQSFCGKIGNASVIKFSDETSPVVRKISPLNVILIWISCIFFLLFTMVRVVVGGVCAAGSQELEKNGVSRYFHKAIAEAKLIGIFQELNKSFYKPGNMMYFTRSRFHEFISIRFFYVKILCEVLQSLVQ